MSEWVISLTVLYIFLLGIGMKFLVLRGCP